MIDIQKDKKNYQTVVQKKAPDNTFIVKLKNFSPGVKIVKFKSKEKNKDFLKSKNFHKSPELRHF